MEKKNIKEKLLISYLEQIGIESETISDITYNSTQMGFYVNCSYTTNIKGMPLKLRTLFINDSDIEIFSRNMKLIKII